MKKNIKLMDVYATVNLKFSNINTWKNVPIISLAQCKRIIVNTLINSHGHLHYHHNRVYFVNRVGQEFYYSVVKHTEFCGEIASFAERIYCVVNNVTALPICQCGKKIYKFTRRGTIKDWGYNAYCSQKCANRYTNYKRSAEFYHNIGAKTSATRKRLNSYKLNDKQRALWWTKEANAKRQQTNIKRYGVANPGVLGAFYSKSGLKYIQQFLIDNQIDDDCCYYKGGGCTGKEFYQMIECDGKKRYFSYDLVVFKNAESAKSANVKDIMLVLEYNGIWHYKSSDVIGKENEPSHPYPNAPSKINVINSDKIKLNHIAQYTPKILIYWLKTKKLEEYLVLND
jgi:hypothetical protein